MHRNLSQAGSWVGETGKILFILSASNSASVADMAERLGLWQRRRACSRLMRSYLSPFVVAIQRSARASRAARAKWMKLLERLPIFSLPEAQGLVESGVSILIPPNTYSGLIPAARTTSIYIFISSLI